MKKLQQVMNVLLIVTLINTAIIILIIMFHSYFK